MNVRLEVLITQVQWEDKFRCMQKVNNDVHAKTGEYILYLKELVKDPTKGTKAHCRGDKFCMRWKCHQNFLINWDFAPKTIT